MEKRVNVTGLLLLFAGTFVGGCIVSAVYLLLLPLLLKLDTRFGFILPVLFGVGAGAFSGVMIKFFKIENAVQAGAVVLLGCLGFSYFKWALYLANDYRDFTKTEDYETALAVYAYIDENYADPLHKPYTYEAIKGIWAKDELAEYFGETADEAAEYISSLLYDDSWFGYYCDLRDLEGKDPSAVYYMSHPKVMMQRIRQINIEGRWTYEDNQVNGVFYAVLWIGEFLLICVPAVAVAVVKAKNTIVLQKVPMGVPIYGANASGANADPMGAVEYTPHYAPPGVSLGTGSGIPELPDSDEPPDLPEPDENMDIQNDSFDFDGFTESDGLSSAPETLETSQMPELEPFGAPGNENEINFDNFDQFFK